MGLYSLRNFLSFDDVADYLRDNNVYDFDLDKPEQRDKLKSFIHDLMNERIINPVFRFCGVAIEQIYRNNAMLNKEITIWIDDYLMIDREMFALFAVGKQEQVIMDYYYELYDNTNNQEFMYFYKSLHNRFINFMDLLYPKIDFEQVLVNKQPKIDSLQAENDRLKAEIERLTAESNQSTKTNPVINITLEMQIINEVYTQFWENLKSNEIPPKKETIVDWIKSEYDVSDRIAKAIDTIARPEKHRTGGQKTR